MTGSLAPKSFRRALGILSLVLLFFTVAGVVPSWAEDDEPAAEFSFDVEIPDSPVVEGKFFRVTVKSDAPIKSVEGMWMGRKVAFFEEKNEAGVQSKFSALVGVEVDHQTGSVPLELVARTDDGESRKSVSLQVNEGTFPAETLTVPPRKVAPLARDLPRIRREQALVRKIYEASASKIYWDPPVVMPIDSAVTSIFGSKRVYNGIKQSAHYGTDLRAKSGTPIVAPISGKVVLAKNLFFTGGTIILDHGYGFFTVYAHLSRMKAKVGQEVKKGSVIALSGATGRVSGPHLHWGAQLHGVKIDPMVLVQGLR